MESSPTANVQQEAANDESSEVLTVCFETPVILRKILEFVPAMELLQQHSFVNKLWNHEARSVLRDRAYLLARISPVRPCQSLAVFASRLRSMNVVPFAGIIVMMSQCDVTGGCAASPASGFDPSSYDLILHRLQWRWLHVSFHYPYEGFNKNCPAFLLMKKILQDFGGVLESLSVAIFFNRGDYFQDVLQDCKFSRLKSLMLLDPNDTTSQDYTRLIKSLVSRAPNLKELHIQERVELNANLLQGSSALLMLSYEVSPTVDEIPDNIVKSLRIRRLKLMEIRQDVSLQSISLTTSMLLQASRTTLTSMVIDAAFLAPLMCYGISLDKVINLTVYFSVSHPFGLRILRLVKEFDFTRILPSLTRVDCIVYSYVNTILQTQITEMIEQSYPALNEPVPDRAVNITSLRLCFAENLEDINPAFLPVWLPHIETLLVTAHRGDVIPRFLLEQPWANLKDLEIEKAGHNPSRNGNLDSVFCGIFPEEAAELREKDDEYLNAVNIVPVMPSIACLKGLRSFTFNGDSGCLSRRGANSSGTDEAPAEMFSKVTGLVAFKRYPGLSVTLKTDDVETKRELDHMKPYADVLLGPPVVRGR